MTPRSPWIASAGCRKNAGVPVLVSVAAILRQMMPDLPMPVRITRPRQCAQQLAPRASNRSSSRVDQREDRRGFGLEHLARQRRDQPCERAPRRLLGDRVDRDQPPEQRLEQVEPQRVLRVALRARRLLVHLEKHAVDAGGDAGRRERLDVLGQAGGDAVAAAGQLQAVRDVEHDRHADARASSETRACRRPGCGSRSWCRAR